MPDINIPPDPDPVLVAYLVRTAPRAHADVIDLYFEWKSPDTPAAFVRKASQAKAGHGQTTQISLEKSGVLRTVRNGEYVLTKKRAFFRF